MASKNTTATAIAVIVVLVGAIGIGYGIRQIRKSQAVIEAKPAPVAQVTIPEVEPVAAPEVEPAPAAAVAQPEPAPVEEPVVEEPAPEPAAAAVAATEPQPEPEPVQEQPQQPQWQPGANAERIQQFFSNLHLNDEEQARLRQGFALIRQRFENMSDTERQAEMARMRDMGQRWMQMSPDQQQQVIDDMQRQYEVWRRSDSIEIPQLDF